VERRKARAARTRGVATVSPELRGARGASTTRGGAARAGRAPRAVVARVAAAHTRVVTELRKLAVELRKVAPGRTTAAVART